VGVSRDCPNFSSAPYYLRNGFKLRTSNFVRTFLVSIGTKVHYNFGRKCLERGRILGLRKFFECPLIISGTGKATNFKFCTHIVSIDRNKSPLQISGKVVWCVVRTLKNFQGTHRPILGESRGLLCDSSAVLFCLLHT